MICFWIGAAFLELYREQAAAKNYTRRKRRDPFWQRSKERTFIPEPLPRPRATKNQGSVAGGAAFPEAKSHQGQKRFFDLPNLPIKGAGP